MKREEDEELYADSKLNLWSHAKCSVNELGVCGLALHSLNCGAKIYCYKSHPVSFCISIVSPSLGALHVRVENQAMKHQLKY